MQSAEGSSAALLILYLPRCSLDLLPLCASALQVYSSAATPQGSELIAWQRLQFGISLCFSKEILL